MTNKSKAKGTAVETAFVKYCREKQGLPFVERRALSGGLDRGDIAGIPYVVIEIKAAVKQEIKAWQEETIREIANDVGAEFGALVVKIPRKSIAQWDAYIPLWCLSSEFNNLKGVWCRVSVEDLFHILWKKGYT